MLMSRKRRLPRSDSCATSASFGRYSGVTPPPTTILTGTQGEDCWARSIVTELTIPDTYPGCTTQPIQPANHVMTETLVIWPPGSPRLILRQTRRARCCLYPSNGECAHERPHQPPMPNGLIHACALEGCERQDNHDAPESRYIT